MENLLACGYDYFDAEQAFEAAQLPDETLEVITHGIAISLLMEDEDLQYHEGLFIPTNNIEIMMMGLESNPITLN